MERWIWLMVGMVAAAGVALVLAGEYLARQPRTHREAVMRVLDARGVRYDDVVVTSVCGLSPRDCVWNGADSLYVTVFGEVRVDGRIVFQRRGGRGDGYDYVLSLPELGIRAAVLPHPARERGWAEVLARGVRYIEGALGRG